MDSSQKRNVRIYYLSNYQNNKNSLIIFFSFNKYLLSIFYVLDFGVGPGAFSAAQTRGAELWGRTPDTSSPSL